ncbi:hypothetical protein M413DRAFT_31832 [Hebeloma cylindrosporum]|uniref:DUF3533 domain-containing protein n=1 Tax=Hebeloma cylindrosporum TaxID=76867 RepID=A0A0C3BHN9_HEBCY|nr:hypothetical protein M413DRAFT_31832 [Hebeloma cylindrosporum h7]
MSSVSSASCERKEMGSTMRGFSDRSKEGAVARATYLKIFVGGCFMTVVLIFAVFSIFWGALWKIPAHNLPGWVVDFDGGLIGQSVVQALSAQPGASKVTWTVVPASQFPGGAHEVGAAVLEEHTWVAIVINPDSSSRLTASLTAPNATYNGADAITVFAVEGRNENAFRSLIRPSVQGIMDGISQATAIQVAQRASSLPTLISILTTSPQTIVSPVSYRFDNLAPFDMPIATAVTFVGLIYQLILSFFIVMIGTSAREAAGFGKTLPTRSLIILRLASCFGAYFVISLFYCLLSLAFQLDLTRKFGHGGFMIFWMLNYVNMLAVGLALEALLTLLTQKFIPFFMLTWIITNLSGLSTTSLAQRALYYSEREIEASDLAASYAALILADEGIEITADKIVALTNAANVELEPIWATLLEKALAGKNVKELLLNVGAGGGAPAAGSAAPAAGAAAAEAPKEEEKKEEEKEESDDDMGFGLFD